MLAPAYVVRLRNAAKPAKARSPVSTIIAHSESVGIAGTTMKTSLAILFVKTVSPPPDTVTVFVPLEIGRTVRVIGKADPPGAMTLELEHCTASLGKPMR